jgi:hypothetical protein
MKPECYQQVALAKDIPEHHLMRGDLATLLEYVPHPKGGEEGCLLEIFNALGESIAVVTVPVSVIEPLRANEIMSVRQLEKIL